MFGKVLRTHCVQERPLLQRRVCWSCGLINFFDISFGTSAISVSLHHITGYVHEELFPGVNLIP